MGLYDGISRAKPAIYVVVVSVNSLKYTIWAPERGKLYNDCNIGHCMTTVSFCEKSAAMSWWLVTISAEYMEYEQSGNVELNMMVCWNCENICKKGIICTYLRGYCTSGPYFWRLCAFSQKIKQLWTKYPMDLVRNIPKNSKITVLLQ